MLVSLTENWSTNRGLLLRPLSRCIEISQETSNLRSGTVFIKLPSLSISSISITESSPLLLAEKASEEGTDGRNINDELLWGQLREDLENR